MMSKSPESEASPPPPHNPFSLYVHIPFCTFKCPYCDFNSYEWERFNESKQTLEERYVNALIQELNRYSESPSWNGREISSIFFGGGTPSLLSIESIEKILSGVRERFAFVESCEVTLEANPGSMSEELGAEKFVGFRRAGINRISMGAQSFSPEKLKFLGRLHSATDTLSAVKNVKAAGFSNFNLDLIFGVAEETNESWLRDLEQVVALTPTHISCYSLTIEPGTKFGKLKLASNLPELDDDTMAELFTTTGTFLADHSYKRYEISNFAKEGLHCRHNLSYWNGSDYLGLGAGAHSFHRKLNLSPDNTDTLAQRWINLPGPVHYIESLTNGGLPLSKTEEITQDQSRLEFLFLSLRIVEGIDLTLYRALFGNDLRRERERELIDLHQRGLTSQSTNRLRLTEKGFLFTDEVLKALC